MKNLHSLSRLLLLSILIVGVAGFNDAFSQASVVAGSTAVSKTAYTVGTGKNRLIVVVVSDEATTVGSVINPLGITWGGQNLTRAASISSGTTLRGEIWYLNEAGISAARGSCSYNFVVNWTGGTSPTAEAFTAFTLQNIDQTTPVAAANTATAAGLASVALPATASGINDIAVYGAATTSSATITAIGAGYTLINTQVIAGTTTLHVAAKQTPAASSETPAPVWNVTGTQILIAGVVFNGITATATTTYYSFATGAWDANTSWSLSSDGSTGAVPVGVWPTRSDNVVIRSGHTITVDAKDDNKSCGVSPDGLARANVSSTGSPFAGSNLPMFYQTGDILISGTLTVSAEIMVEGYTHVVAGGTLLTGSTLVNLGNLEADASSTLSVFDDMVLTGYSTTLINTTALSNDDLIFSYSNATLCGTGSETLNGGFGSTITYVNGGAGPSQICNTFTVGCSGVGCTGFPVTGAGDVISGNTGPGGVGSSVRNKLWLKADNLSLANGAKVTNWVDVSGNGLAAVANTNPSLDVTNQPSFTTNTVNTILPALTFDGGDWLTLGTPAVLNLVPQTNSMTFFGAFNVATGTANSGTFLSKAINTPSDVRQYQFQTDGGAGDRYTAWVGSTFIQGALTTATGGWALGTSVVTTSATAGYSSWINERADISGNAIGNATTTVDVLVGARRVDATSTATSGFRVTGKIAELILYNAAVNNAQRIIIHNYLSAKYDIALFTNDVYTMDNSGFDFEVAGIGQAADNSSQRDSRGSDIVRMWDASNLPNTLGVNQFLMWGHDNSKLVSSTTTVGVGGVDGTVIKERLTRIWGVTKSGTDVGTVSISFDLTSFPAALGSNLRLLIDRNGNGFQDNDVTPITGTAGGNSIVFSGVNFVNGDRFTLGNTDLAHLLPVELISFKATPENHTVRLQWTTASEKDNDFFTIERSKDALTWESGQRIQAAGTSKTKTKYESVDDGPYTGISYYRLQQTDLNGEFKHSGIARVFIDYKKPITIYPNPFKTSFKLSAEFEVNVEQVRLYNASGIQLPVALDKQGSEVSLDPGNIPPGLYMLQVQDGYKTKTIKVIKSSASEWH
jgi:hypothetical protein